jgi:hypothetical protein
MLHFEEWKWKEPRTALVSIFVAFIISMAKCFSMATYVEYKAPYDDFHFSALQIMQSYITTPRILLKFQAPKIQKSNELGREIIPLEEKACITVFYFSHGNLKAGAAAFVLVAAAAFFGAAATTRGGADSRLPSIFFPAKTEDVSTASGFLYLFLRTSFLLCP